MTGTDPAVTPISKRLAHYLPTGGDGSGRIVSDAGGITGSSPVLSMDRKSLEMADLDAPGRDVSAAGGSAPRWTRTINPLIKSQLLCQLS